MSTNKKGFKELSNKEDLLAFLWSKGKNHNEYHHYTTLDSAIKIIKNKSFFLTRGNSTSMNDQHEPTIKGSSVKWEKIYIGSFAFGENENMAMWGLYGLPKEDAVRITIPGKFMRLWFNRINEINGVNIANGVVQCGDANNSFEKHLSDIVYIDGKQHSDLSKLYWNDNSLAVNSSGNLHSIASEIEMTGFIKNFAWKYENEVRLHICTHYNINYEKISVHIPDEVVNEMIITAGPCFEGDLSERISQKIQSNHLLQNSGFKGLVNYRTLCSMCSYESFRNKFGGQ